MGDDENGDRNDGETSKPEKMFTLKKWNAVAMWSWDVECDTCAICRVQVMGKQSPVLGYVLDGNFGSTTGYENSGVVLAKMKETKHFNSHLIYCSHKSECFQCLDLY